jgi:hypothetical protein
MKELVCSILPADCLNDMKVLSNFPVVTENPEKEVGKFDVHNVLGNWVIDLSAKLLADSPGHSWLQVLSRSMTKILNMCVFGSGISSLAWGGFDLGSKRERGNDLTQMGPLERVFSVEGNGSSFRKPCTIYYSPFAETRESS